MVTRILQATGLLLALGLPFLLTLAFAWWFPA